ncbi:threonine ammonia-lyase [soil metagenome]
MDYDDLLAARDVLGDFPVTTPATYSRWLSDLAGTDVYLKCENLQRTGSFKPRGAYVRLARLTPEERAQGVVAASAGNHAQGVALAASLLGAKATIFMPDGAAIPKVAATQGYGARVEFAGPNISTALVAAQDFAAKTGAIFIHPFDHSDVIAGQGTVALEILEQVPDVRTILVPLGGGGLAAGVAAIRTKHPEVKVVGVQAERAAAFPESLHLGAPYEIQLGATMADGIAVGRPGDLTYALVSELVDEVVTVGEESMSQSLLLLLERAKMLVEPSGAAGVAALLESPRRFEGPVVPILSGGNIDSLILLQVIRHGLAAAGRFLMFRVRISDRPGELMRLLTDLAAMQLNVLNIHHDRASASMGVDQVEVQMQVATRGIEHRELVKKRLVELGYDLGDGL